MTTALIRAAVPCTLILILFSGCAANTPPTPQPLSADRQAKLKTEYQAKVKQFEAAIEKIDKSVMASQDKLAIAASAASKDASSLPDTINLAREFKNELDNATLEISGVSIDKDLPPDTRDAMANAQANMRLSCGYRSDAMVSILKYFDEQKPSLLADYQNQIRNSDANRTQAALYLGKARLSVGLK